MSVEQLREERRRLSDECARITWWRRLVHARRDLLVADLGGAPELPSGLESVAGLATLPTQRTGWLAPSGPAGGADDLRGLSELDRTLARAEDEALGRLEETTRALVARLSDDPAAALAALPRA